MSLNLTDIRRPWLLWSTPGVPVYFVVNRDAVSLGHGLYILVVQAFFFENSIDPVCVTAARLREIMSVSHHVY